MVMQEQNLNMKRAIYRTDVAHSEIMYSFRDLSNVHALLGSLQKANHYQEKSFEMSGVTRYHMSATAQRHLATKNDELTEMRIFLRSRVETIR